MSVVIRLKAGRLPLSPTEMSELNQLRNTFESLSQAYQAKQTESATTTEPGLQVAIRQDLTDIFSRMALVSSKIIDMESEGKKSLSQSRQ